MRAESLLEVIHAAFNGKIIEIHCNGLWFRWTGPMIALVEEMQSGTLFRVKREPRTIWMEQDAARRLTGVCWTGEDDAIAEVGGGNTIVEFSEVL